MPHTQSRYQQDLGFTDGKVFAGPGDVFVTGTAGAATSNAPGFSLLFPNSAASHIGINLTQQVMRRLGFFEDLQEQFGGAGIPASAQTRTYRPDVIGAMSAAQQLQPRTAFKTKGFRLISFDVIYTVAGGALATNTIRVDSIGYVNNVAPTNAVVLAAGANGLASAVQAQQYVITVTPTVQNYFTLNDSVLWIDWTIVNAAGGTLNFFGFDIMLEYNFN